MGDKPPVPAGLKGPGRKFWASIMAEFELETAEMPLFLQACQTMNVIAALQAVVDSEGVMAESPQGVKAHPALIESRQQRLVLAKLLGQLGIPSDEAVR